MATLAEQRRAIRDGVNSTRAATGADERRATGRRIEAERRGETVVQDLNRLITPQTQRRTLRTVPPVGAVPATRGRGNYTPPQNTGGSIASPLTEQTRIEGGNVVPDRDRYPEISAATSDGLFTFLLEPLKTLRWTDANNAPGQIDLAAPGAP